MSADTATPAGGRLRGPVAILIALEAIPLLAVAVYLLFAVVTSRLSSSDSPGAVLFLAALALVLGIVLVACARGVWQARSWTRGPVLTWQLVQAGVSLPLSSSGAWWAGVPLLAVAIIVGVLIVGKYVVPRRELPS